MQIVLSLVSLTSVALAGRFIDAVLAQPHEATCAYADPVGPTFGIDSHLTSLVLSSATYNSPCSGNLGVIGLDNQTATFVALVVPGGSYTLTATFSTCGNVYDAVATAWADWFNTGSFSTGEGVLGTWSGRSDGVVATFQFTVPASQTPGSVRVRLSLVESGYLPMSPCGRWSYGHVIDFTLSVIAEEVCPYSAPAGPRSGIDSHIERIVIDSHSYQPMCPGRAGVDDATHLLNPTVITGSSVNLTVRFGSCGSAYPAIAGVWVDWANTGSFSNALTLHTWSGIANGVDVVFPLQVPVGQPEGTRRMRVMLYEEGQPPISPCSVFDWGSVVDASITVRPPVTCSALEHAGPTTTVDSHISRLELGATVVDIPCPGVIGVDDRTATFVAPVLAGHSYPLLVTMSSCGGIYASVAAVWVDWSNSGTFTEERNVAGTWAGMSNEVVTFNIQVPVKQATGKVRARISLIEGYSLPISPCATFTWGSTIDVALDISQPPPNQA